MDHHFYLPLVTPNAAGLTDLKVTVSYDKGRKRVDASVYPLTIEDGLVSCQISLMGGNYVVLEPMLRLNRKRLDILFAAAKEGDHGVSELIMQVCLKHKVKLAKKEAASA